MRKPIVVAIANYCFPGLGYLLLQRRVLFGCVMIACVIVQVTQMYIDPYPYVIAYATTKFSLLLALFSIFLFQAAFAYDAYKLAQE